MKKVLCLVLVICFFAIAGASAADTKIGFVDRRTIAFEYNKIKELNSQIEKDYEQAKVEMEQRTTVIRKMSEEMELLSESARKEREPELQTKIREFDDFRKMKMQEMTTKRDEGMKVITSEIDRVSAEYGLKNKYFAILDKGAALYTAKASDVTAEILAELNK